MSQPRKTFLPRPLAELPAAQWAAVRGVMTDIDDTLTRGGKIEFEALAALDLLAAAEVPVIAITGRSLGFCKPLAQAWPVAAIAAENGAVALIREGAAVRIEFAQDAATRAAHGLRLLEVAAALQQQVPGARLAADSGGRVTDIAIDHSEFAHLDADAVARVVALMQAAGMTATVSSIHINGWFGAHDKWSAAQWLVQRLYGRDLPTEIDRWVYVGDSTNDQLLFEHFSLAVGVANLMRFAAELQVWPAFITVAERGAGFAEVARAIVATRARLS